MTVFTLPLGCAPDLPEPERRPGPPLWSLFRAGDAVLQRLVCRSSPRPDAELDLRRAGFAVQDGFPPGLDVVVCAAGGSPATALAAETGAPVWWLDHDGGAAWPEVVSGYAETLRGDEVTSCRLLQLLPGAEASSVLSIAYFSTHPLVATENRMQLLWKSLPLVVKALRVGGYSATEPEVAPRTVRIPDGGAALAATLARHVARAAWFVGRRLLWREQWCLAVIPIECAATGIAPAGGGVTGTTRSVIVPPPDRYWADPHLVPGGDGRLVLVEEYLYATRRGRIAMLTLDDAGAVTATRTILELDGHLSYPSVFEKDGSLYMIPESSDLENLVAYRCVEYPHRWEPEVTLLDGVRAIDSTIVRHEGRWWLFATIQEEKWLTPRDTLWVFFSDDPLTGRWTPHAANPVVCDARRARPAGPLFSRGGHLYRPAQDCGRRYGYGIRISEVVTLTPDDYVEREVAFMPPPGDGFVATHTYGCDENSVIADVLRWLPGRRG